MDSPPHEWDLLPDDLFQLLSHDIVDDLNASHLNLLANQTPLANAPSSSSSAATQTRLGSATSPAHRQDVTKATAIGVPKPALNNSVKAAGKDERGISAVVDRICRARSETSIPRTGPTINPRMRMNICHVALGPGTWSPLSRPLIYENHLIVGTETAQVRGPENYRSMTGLILCDVTASWARRDSSRPMRTETEFVGTDSAIQDIQWVKPGESCVYATETELSVCGFNKRKHLIEARDPQDRIRQIAVSHERMVTGGFDEKVCLYSLSEGRRGLYSFWDMRGVVGGVAWYPSDVNVLTYTTDPGELGLIDIRSSSREPALRCDLGRGHLYAHCVVAETICALGYGSGYGCLMDLRKAADVPMDVWRDPTLTAIGEFIDSTSCGITPRNSPALTVAAGIGGLSIWDFTSGEAKCLGQANPLPEYADFPFPSIGFKTSGVFVSGQDMVYAQTDAAGYLSLYDVGRH